MSLRCCVAIAIAAAAVCGGACSRRGVPAAKRFIENGDRYARRGDTKGAAIEYQNAIRQSPSLIEAHVRLADALVRLHDDAAAATELTKIAALQPKDLTAQLQAAKASAAIGRMDQARTAFLAALAIDPAQADANRGIAVLYTMGGRSRDAEPYWKAYSTSPAGDRLALADFYARERRYADAERELRALVGVPKLDIAARLRLATVLFDAGRRKEADAIVQAVLRADAGSAAPWLIRGRMRVAEKRLPEAADAYARALGADPSSIEALTGATALDLAAKRTADAQARLERRLAAEPDAVPVLMLAARTYLSTGRDDRAESTLQRIVELAPQSLEAYGLLGQLYVRHERLDAAREKFEAVAARARDPLPAKTMIAMILDAQHRGADAQREYEAILKVNASAGVAANNLAWIYLAQGKTEDALRYALVAKSALRAVPQASDTLGWIYYRMDRPRDAVPLLAECVERQPNNPLYNYHLGMAYLKAGSPIPAREQLTAALASRHDFDGRAEAEQAVATLGAQARR